MRATVVWNFARKELAQSLRERSFVALAALLLLLFIVSSCVGVAAQRAAANESKALQDTVDRLWEDQPDRHPHRVAHYGNFAFRPQPELSFIDSGVDDYTGNSIFLEAHVQNSANFSEARQDSSLLRFGKLTPAFILQVLVPLLVVFSLSRSVTSEREGGTLAILQACGTADREFLMGKALGSVLLFVAILIPALSLSIALVFEGNLMVDRALDFGVRAGLLLAVYSAYLMVWITLAIWVSARAKSSGNATVSLLGIWIVFVVLIPKSLPSLGSALYPALSRPEFEHALHQEVVLGGHGHDPGSPQFEQMKQELLQKHGVRRVEDLPVNFRGVAMKEGEKSSAAVYQKYYRQQQETYHRQNKVAETGALINPYLAVRHLSMALCATDFRHAADFEQQAENYRYNLMQKLNDIHTHEVSYDGDKEQRVSASHWKEIPTFSFHPKPWRESIRPQLSALLALGLQLLVMLILLFKTKVRPR